MISLLLAWQQVTGCPRFDLHNEEHVARGAELPSCFAAIKDQTFLYPEPDDCELLPDTWQFLIPLLAFFVWLALCGSCRAPCLDSTIVFQLRIQSVFVALPLFVNQTEHFYGLKSHYDRKHCGCGQEVKYILLWPYHQHRNLRCFLF